MPTTHIKQNNDCMLNTVDSNSLDSKTGHSCLYYNRYLLSLQYTVLHIILLHILFSKKIFSITIFMYILLSLFHGADLTYISLLVIFCIIVYVTNKKL